MIILKEVDEYNCTTSVQDSNNNRLVPVESLEAKPSVKGASIYYQFFIGGTEAENRTTTGNKDITFKWNYCSLNSAATEDVSIPYVLRAVFDDGSQYYSDTQFLSIPKGTTSMTNSSNEVTVATASKIATSTSRRVVTLSIYVPSNEGYELTWNGNAGRYVYNVAGGGGATGTPIYPLTPFWCYEQSDSKYFINAIDTIQWYSNLYVADSNAVIDLSNSTTNLISTDGQMQVSYSLAYGDLTGPKTSYVQVEGTIGARLTEYKAENLDNDYNVMYLKINYVRYQGTQRYNSFDIYDTGTGTKYSVQVHPDEIFKVAIQ